MEAAGTGARLLGVGGAEQQDVEQQAVWSGRLSFRQSSLRLVSLKLVSWKGAKVGCLG